MAERSGSGPSLTRLLISAVSKCHDECVFGGGTPGDSLALFTCQSSTKVVQAVNRK